MNKLFMVLLVLTLAGAGVLWWLIQVVPQDSKTTAGDSHAKPAFVASSKGEHSKDDSHGHDDHKDAESATAAEDVKADADHDKITEKDKANDSDPHASGAADHAATDHAQDAKDSAKKEETEHQHKVTPVAQAKLKISTEPDAAEVFIEGKSLGKTPLEIPLLNDKTQNVKLQADGYEEFNRLAPEAPEQGDLAWKIQLKSKKLANLEKKVAELNTKESAAHEAPHAKEESHKPVKEHQAKEHSPPPAPTPPLMQVHAQPKGEESVSVPAQSGYFIQVKSLSREEFPRSKADEELKNIKTSLGLGKARLCLVDLGKRGQWIRVQAGPWASKDRAEEELRLMKSKYESVDPVVNEAFVTKSPQCKNF